jgi:hypothetical protein
VEDIAQSITAGADAIPEAEEDDPPLHPPSTKETLIALDTLKSFFATQGASCDADVDSMSLVQKLEKDVFASLSRRGIQKSIKDFFAKYVTCIRGCIAINNSCIHNAHHMCVLKKCFSFALLNRLKLYCVHCITHEVMLCSLGQWFPPIVILRIIS